MQAWGRLGQRHDWPSFFSASPSRRFLLKVERDDRDADHIKLLQSRPDIEREPDCGVEGVRGGLAAIERHHNARVQGWAPVESA